MFPHRDIGLLIQPFFFLTRWGTFATSCPPCTISLSQPSRMCVVLPSTDSESSVMRNPFSLTDLLSAVVGLSFPLPKNLPLVFGANLDPVFPFLFIGSSKIAIPTMSWFAWVCRALGPVRGLFWPVGVAMFLLSVRGFCPFNTTHWHCSFLTSAAFSLSYFRIISFKA